MKHPLRILVLPALAISMAASAGAQAAGSGATIQGSKIVFAGPGGHSYPVATVGPEVSDLRTVDSAGVVAVTWREGRTPHYAVSLDGGMTFGRQRETSYEIMLRYAEFDPLADGEPVVPPGLRAQPGGELFVVQYVAKGTQAWRERIRDLGAVDHRFLAWHANVWRMTPDTAARVAELPFVRWVGAFHPAYKLENELMADYRFDHLTTRRYNVVVGEWGPREKEIVAQAIREMGGVVEKQIDEGWILEATLTPAQLVAVAGMDEVFGVDRWGEPETDMDNVRVTHGTSYVESQMPGLDGTGLRAEVMDGGLDTIHTDWTNPPIESTSPGFSTAHGTCTFGINFGNGTSTSGGQSRGVNPMAQGVFASYSTYGNRYTHTAKLVDPGQIYKCVYQSNSWGDPRTTQYTSKSQEMDDIIYLNDFQILQSQSNSGWQDSRPQAWAKNVIAVGGVYHFNNQNHGDDRWSNGASIGPAADGRIKPDLCSYYDATWTSDAEPGGYVSGDDYSSFGGTSNATPITAGHTGKFFQMWHAGMFGNATGGSVFDSRPHCTMAKAMMINSARQYNFSGTGHDLTRTHQGWGAPDVQYLYDKAGEMFWINETDVLQDQQSVSYSVDVVGATEFRATLVYIDRAGTTSSSLHRINDLTLKVTAPGGTIYWGNNGLLSSNYSTPGGSSNTKDTVEQVLIQAPPSGTYTIEVIADEVNQDTHPENGVSPPDADFALVVSPTGTIGATDTILLVGPTLAFPNSTVTWQISQAPGNETFYMLWSLSNAGSTLLGHQFDLGLPVNVGGTGTTASDGSGSFTATIPAGASGKTIYIEVGVDSNGFIFDSNVLGMVVT